MTGCGDKVTTPVVGAGLLWYAGSLSGHMGAFNYAPGVILVLKTCDTIFFFLNNILAPKMFPSSALLDFKKVGAL